MIIVTHDQAEAMTLADQIVVMNERRIQQVGTPMEIYARPANAFVARFVGSPAMTLLPAELLPGDGFARLRLAGGVEIGTRVAREALGPGLSLGLRPEDVTVVAPGTGDVDGETVLVERLGDRTHVHARLADGSELIAQDIGFSRARLGDRVGLAIAGAAAHLFEADGTGRHAEQAG